MVERLSISFIEMRPLAAARVLRSLRPEEATAFLEKIPSRLVTSVFLEAGSWSAASILACMESRTGAAALRDMTYLEAAAILRLVPAPRRSSLLAELPTRLRRDFETSLSFPQDTVGAHMRLSPATLGSRHSVEDARDLIARAPRGEVDVLFVVDPAGGVVGAVDAATLLQCDPPTALGEVARLNPPLLSARARIESVRDLEAWDDFASLPVVSRQGQIVGTLQRHRLRWGIDPKQMSDPSGRDSIVMSLTQAFLTSAIGVARLMTEGLPAGASSRESETRR